MKIGKVEFDLEELLSNKPPEPRFKNPFAHKDCDCVDCAEIIKNDAYWMWGDNDHIEDEEQLAEAVSKFNWGMSNA